MTRGVRREVAQTGSSKDLLWLFLAGSALLFVMLRLFWVGFLGSDDSSYWEGSTGWLEHFPYLGRDHWTLRHTLVIPMALARLVFGNGPISVALPTILYAEGLIAVIGFWVWRTAGRLAAFIALALVVTYPQVVIYSSTADIDIIELFFVFSGFCLLGSVVPGVGEASTTDGTLAATDRRKLVFAGAFLGLALLSRETAAFAIIAIMLFCLTQYRLRRQDYLFILAGAAVVVSLENIYLWSLSGHFFYRYSLDAHHDKNIDRWKDQGAAIPYVHPAVDPFIMLLLNHNFSLVSWIAVPLSIWYARRNDVPRGERVLIVLLGTLALVWTGLAAALWKSLVLIPRYYLVPAVCILVLAALALNQMWRDGRRWLPWILGALLVTSNILALALDNRNFMFGEDKLVELAKVQHRKIHTDALTLRHADLLLNWAGVRQHVTDAPIGPGDLVFVNPLRPHAGLTPAADWKLLYESPVPLSGGHLIACSLPKQFVPKAMLSAIGCHHVLLRLFEAGAIR